MHFTSRDDLLEFTAKGEAEWAYDAQNRTLSTTAPSGTDIFIDPASPELSEGIHNAPTFMTPAPAGDFQFSARVAVSFEATFDAGVLLLRSDTRTWAKLCFEFSPASEAMVVSVVNDGGTSDDANSFTVVGNEIFLRISRTGPIFTFHASLDGAQWQLVRLFSLQAAEALEIGFEAQSPTGDGCTVTFHDFTITDGSLQNARDGS